MTLNCTDCNVTFDPNMEGVVGGTMAFCGPCCAEDDKGGALTCAACGDNVPHVDTLNGWCDPCHDDFRVFNDMADRMNNGATFMEA